MYTLAKHLTTQNLTSNSPFWLIWNIATFVINTNLHQNDLKINNFCCFSICFGLFSLSQDALLYLLCSYQHDQCNLPIPPFSL